MAEYQPPSPEEIRAIAEAYYRERLAKTSAVPEPTLTLVGGQTGAGKTAAATLVRAEYRQVGGSIHLDADRMRERIDLRGARPTSEQTQVTAGALVGALRALAIDGSRNLLEEGTFRNPEGLQTLVRRVQTAGYRVELVAVATPLEESRLGIYQRFEAQHAQHTRNPRFVTDQYHDGSAEGFAATVARVSGQFDRVRVISRGGDLHFDSRSAGQGDSALDALRRGRTISDVRLSEVARSWTIVHALAQDRGADAAYLTAVQRHHDRVLSYQDSRREFETAMDAKQVDPADRLALRELFEAEVRKRVGADVFVGDKVAEKGVSAFERQKSNDVGGGSDRGRDRERPER